MGVTHAQVWAGHPDAVARIAELGDTDAASLRHFTPERMSAAHVTLAGERLPVAMCVQREIRVCPGCLRADKALNHLSPELAVHLRATWLVGYLRTCPAHHLPLVKVSLEESGSPAQDFSRAIQPHLDRLLDPAFDPPTREASGLDRFVTEHIEKGRGTGGGWFDSLSLHAVARFAEVLGVTIIWGRMGVLEALSDDELASAGARGFEVIAEGPAALSAALEELRTSRGKPQDGPQARYAPLYDWCSREAGDTPEFEPLRAVLRQHILEQWPLGQGARVLGHKVAERRLHSIRTASLEWNIHPKTLRKILAAAGLVGESADERGDAAEVFAVERALPLVDAFVGSLSFEDARVRLNMSRSQMDALIEGGLLSPARAPGARRPRFQPDELARFEAAIEARLVPHDQTTTAVTIPEAVKTAKAKADATVRAILDGHLPAMRRPGTSGYNALLVEAERLREIVHGPRPTSYLSFREAHELLGLPRKMLLRLIGLGVLQAHQGFVPNTSMAMTQLDRRSVEEFQKVYVSLPALAHELERREQDVRSKVGQLGIQPVFNVSWRDTPIYRRSELSVIQASARSEAR